MMNQTCKNDCSATNCCAINCPCSNTDCPRHSNCIECIKFHRDRQSLVACMREIAKNANK